MKTSSPSRQDGGQHGPLLVVAGAALFLAAPSLITGRAVTGFDGEATLRAMHQLMATLAPGQVFVPQMAGGYPIVLDNIVSPSPLTALWARVGYDPFFGVALALHLFLAGWGMLRLLARFGVTGTVAAVAAVGWLASPQLTGRLVVDGYLSFFATALLPHLFTQVVDVYRRPGAFSVAALAAWVAVAFMEGNPGLVTAYVFAAVAFGLILAYVEERLTWRFFGLLALAGVVSIPLCLPVVWGLVTLFQEGPRTNGLTLGVGLGGMPVESLLTLWLPGVFGRDAQGIGHLGRGFAALNMLYIGVVWPVAVFSKRFLTRDRMLLALALTTLLFLLLALGLPSPVLAVVQRAGWPLSVLRLPVRWAAPMMMLVLTMGAIVVRTHVADGSPLRIPRWVRMTLVGGFAFGGALGLIMLAAPFSWWQHTAAFLMRDPGRLSDLQGVTAAQWRQGGLLLLLETAVFATATAWLLKQALHGRWRPALGMSAGLCLVAALPHCWFTFRHQAQPVPVPTQVARTSRVLSLMSSHPLEGKYFLMHELLSQRAVGSLLSQGYTTMQASLPLPHAGWQGLFSGDRHRTVETGATLNQTALRVMGVRWVLTRDTPHHRCDGTLTTREKAMIILETNSLPNPKGQPEGLLWDFLCLNTGMLEVYGWRRAQTDTPGFVWWRNHHAYSGAYFVQRTRHAKDPFGTLLKNPQLLLSEPPVGWQPARQKKPSKKKNRLTGAPDVPVQFTQHPSGTYRVSLQAPRPGMVVLTLPYWRHYRAMDQQGNVLPVRRIGGALTGIEVPRGQHLITLSYAYPLRPLKLAMWAAWGVLALAWWRFRPAPAQ